MPFFCPVCSQPSSFSNEVELMKGFLVFLIGFILFTCCLDAAGAPSDSTIHYETLAHLLVA